MAHECEYCGQWCYCDCDDIPFPQPANCVHMSKDGACHEFNVEMGIEEPYDDKYDDDTPRATETTRKEGIGESGE